MSNAASVWTRGAYLFHIGLFALLQQFDIILIQGKGLPVLRMGVQIESKLLDNKSQGLEFRVGTAGNFPSVFHQMKGQIQTGEQSAFAQGLHAAVALGGGGLERHKGHRERGAAGQSAAAVPAGGGFFWIFAR